MDLSKQNTPAKRVLVLFGSPHPKGSTAALVNRLQVACPAAWQWDWWHGFDNPIAPCDDCRYCYQVAGCRYSDLDDLFNRLEQADVLVFATPVYNLSFSSPLKTMIDRTQRYWAARFMRGEKPPIARPKRAVLLSVAEQDDHAGECLAAQLKPTLTILNAHFTAQMHCLRTTSPDEQDEGIQTVAAMLMD